LTSSEKYNQTKYDGWTQSDIEHGHRHEQIDTAGKFVERVLPVYDNRDWEERTFTVGIGGYVFMVSCSLLFALVSLSLFVKEGEGKKKSSHSRPEPP